MSVELFTARLRLITLTALQLGQCLTNITKLGKDMGLVIVSDIVDINVTRAINMKLSKMAVIDSGLLDWLTYWLIVLKDMPLGIGLIGFKGCPDLDGKTEIGYGIATAYRNQGYVTEALQALSAWAFAHSNCRVLTANTVSNPASEKVLQKAGWQKVRQLDESSDWELHKLDLRPSN